MTKLGDVTSIKRIEPFRPGGIMPSRPQLPEGQDRAPTRDAKPGMSVAADAASIPANGGLIQYQQWDGAGWSDWKPLSEQDVRIRIVAVPRPPQGPYKIGGSRETPGAD